MIIRVKKKYQLYALSHLKGKCIGHLGENDYIITDTKEKIQMLENLLTEHIVDLSHISLCLGTVYGEEIGKFPDTKAILQAARNRIMEGII
ncbi:MAG: hypothetical protein JXJ04_15335 [Spirochaetales bacterium]|nr:hypothetical protein [Spirochaetales bacterium]